MVDAPKPGSGVALQVPGPCVVEFHYDTFGQKYNTSYLFLNTPTNTIDLFDDIQDDEIIIMIMTNSCLGCSYM